MPHTPEKLLVDAIAAIEAIQDFMTGKSRGDYDADLMLRSAVERQLEIMGEALRRLEQIDQSSAQKIDEYRRIIGFRNVIAHGYDSIDSDIVWQVLTDKLPVLARQTRHLLASLGSQP